jgi:hypothetical protein
MQREEKDRVIKKQKDKTEKIYVTEINEETKQQTN